MVVIVRKKGWLVNGNYNKLVNALDRAGKEISNTVVSAAMSDYSSKRKTDKEPSLILDSFGYKLTSKNRLKVIYHVYAGGRDSNSPFYTGWVNDGHNLRNKKGYFSGYHFFQTGVDAGNTIIKTAIKAELSKVR